MRRRKDFASLLRNIERPTERNTTMGVASSIGGDGQMINGQNSSDGEVRDLQIALPYGISSSGVDGIRIQIITNDNKNNVSVGVIDKNRPQVRSGCITIYDKAGSTISLTGDGRILLNGNVYINNILFSDIVTRLGNLESNISNISTRLGNLESSISNLPLGDITTKLGELESRVSDLESNNSE